MIIEIEKNEYEQVLQQYEPMIHKIIRTLHIYHDYDYYYHEATVALWHAMKEFNEEKGSFTAFAYTSIRGKLLNILKKESRHQNTHLAWMEGLEETLPDTTISIEEQLKEIEYYMENLTKYQKIWLVGYICYGKRLEEIAIECNTTISAVKSWRRGALQNIKKGMENSDEYIK
ncbi:sigma-70 family RNA polymerase sigma factor [Sutcliffiella halmapala]|uniref:sigma-70 family RNA polymerase sigma factor n=1 Tax=Sutcliffiella halmapala TaxID=79882 RepID=UPI000994F0A2|nr:sigma-70 family RNA polymerase sigma factor [Sutcliffiella halmapala]